MIDFLVSEIPDHYVEGRNKYSVYFSSPRYACRRILTNITHDFPGLQAAKAYCAFVNKEITYEDLSRRYCELTQAIPSCTMGLSIPLIFELIVKIFARLTLGQIGSIQALDSLHGKIFYLDQFESSTETALYSMPVTAHEQYISAGWSIEEMKNFRAYYGIDAERELMGSISREAVQHIHMEMAKHLLDASTQYQSFEKMHSSIKGGVDFVLFDQKKPLVPRNIKSLRIAGLGSRVIGIHTGSEWSDRAFIWSPYTFALEPVQLTDPFALYQRLMLHSAYQVVRPDYIGCMNLAE
jgi:hypothetical protein